MDQLDHAVQFSERMQHALTLDELDGIFDECAFNEQVSDYADWLFCEKQGNEMRLTYNGSHEDMLKKGPYDP